MSEKEHAQADANQEDATQKLYAFVAEQMKAGLDKGSIAEKLQEQGMKRTDAEEAVYAIYGQIEKAVKAERFTPANLVPGSLAGIAAALLGGGIWAAIVILTDYEVGFVAWGIGALCGFAVVLVSGGHKGVPLQTVAVLSSVIGILAGKYFAFSYMLQQFVEREYGADAAAGVTLLSQQTLAAFTESIGDMLGGYDILWVVLAVATAWGIPKGSGIKLPFERGRA